MTIQANQGPGVSVFGATSAGGGGSTSPGGSSGQVQYNNSGAFGGLDLYYSSATLRLGAADAASAVAQTLQVQSVVGSTPGATDVAGANWTIKGSAGRGSGAGGSIIFQVAPAGSAGTGAQNAYATALTIDSTQWMNVPLNRGFRADGNTGFNINLNQDGTIRLNDAGGGIRTATGLLLFGGTDMVVVRDAANTLALRNGTSSQTFNVYNSYTDASNYERLAFVTGGAFEIQAQNAGTGAAKSIQIKGGAGAGFFFGGNGAVQWQVNASGNLLAQSDNNYDIGASGTTNRVRTFYSGGGYSAAGPSIKTANYSQGIHDYSLIFNGSGSITLTLLAAATYPGKVLYVKTIAAQTVVSASSNVKPIDSDTAGTAILAATAGKWAMLQSDGTNWVVMAQG
jgi:hypothetical protein